jgi:Rieske Fe-S protein
MTVTYSSEKGGTMCDVHGSAFQPRVIPVIAGLPTVLTATQIGSPGERNGTQPTAGLL